MPGNGSGNAGTQGDPFEGLSEANSNAIAGDIFLLGSGRYSGATLSRGGTTDNWVVYTEDPADPGAVIDSLTLSDDFIWIDDLTFIANGAEAAISNEGAISDIVVTNNTITGYNDGIDGFAGSGDRWTIMDNTLVGSFPEGIADSGSPGSSSNRGISVGGENVYNNGVGHVIAYNSITRFSDGIGVDGNSDTYGNVVWDTEDDSFSSDGALENVRVWGNRFYNVGGSHVPTQPMLSGPWYFLYNQMADAGNLMFKWDYPDRLVLIHNTFVGTATEAHYFMYSYMRNNLFIANGRAWTARTVTGTGDRLPPVWVADWFTDIDYDGFAGGSTVIRWFDDDGQTDENQAPQALTDYGSDELDQFARDVGIEANAKYVTTAIFDAWNSSGDEALTLAAGSNDAVNAGIAVPNLADFYSGSAPDLGAHDRENNPMPIGPRGPGEISDKDNYWDKH